MSLKRLLIPSTTSKKADAAMRRDMPLAPLPARRSSTGRAGTDHDDDLELQDYHPFMRLGPSTSASSIPVSLPSHEDGASAFDDPFADPHHPVSPSIPAYLATETQDSNKLTLSEIRTGRKIPAVSTTRVALAADNNLLSDLVDIPLSTATGLPQFSPACHQLGQSEPGGRQSTQRARRSGWAKLDRKLCLWAGLGLLVLVVVAGVAIPLVLHKEIGSGAGEGQGR